LQVSDAIHLATPSPFCVMDIFPVLPFSIEVPGA
jgi:hypothetical protein